MPHSGQQKRIFWLIFQRLLWLFFQRLLQKKAIFLSIGNVFLNESFIPAIGEGYFSLMETVTLLENFLLLAETVYAMSGNQFSGQNSFLLVETDFLASGNHVLPLSYIFFKESFIPISRNLFFSPKDTVHYCNQREIDILKKL